MYIFRTFLKLIILTIISFLHSMEYNLLENNETNEFSCFIEQGIIEEQMIGEDALIIATRAGLLQDIIQLLERGANPDAYDNNGMTALMYAAANKDKQAVQILINFCLDIDIKNKQGKTACDIAFNNGNHEIGAIINAALIRKNIILDQIEQKYMLDDVTEFVIDTEDNELNYPIEKDVNIFLNNENERFENPERTNNLVQITQNEQINNLSTQSIENSFNSKKTMVEEIFEAEAKKNCFQCNHKRCGKIFTKESDFFAHNRKHSVAQKIWICNYEDCNKKYTRKENLKIHKKLYHKQLFTSKDISCNYKNCKKLFSTMRGLKLHQRKHTGKDLYFCNICNKSFASRSSLNLHQAIHKSNRDIFACDYKGCTKTYFNKANLVRHIKTIHKKETPYACEICGSKFSYRYGLRLHRNSHKN